MLSKSMNKFGQNSQKTIQGKKSNIFQFYMNNLASYKTNTKKYQILQVVNRQKYQIL